MGLVDGKVALVTGAARGRGRAEAVRLAEEGADIIAVDICAPVETIPYEGATLADLEETAALVRKHGRRIVAVRADVRDLAALEHLDAPTLEDCLPVFGKLNMLPDAFQQPEDVANAVLYLASDLSRVTTGTSLTVDGGASFM